MSTVLLASLLWKVVSFVKSLTNRSSWDPVVTQLIAWIVGVGLAVLAAQASASAGMEVWGTTLGELDGWSLVLLGLTLSSVGGVGVEIKKALDGAQDASQPTLFPGRDRRSTGGAAVEPNEHMEAREIAGRV
jgi:hypothetical protein